MVGSITARFPSRARRTPTRLPMRLLAVAGLALLGAGCVSVAEHRKLENQVIDLQRRSTSGQSRAQVAELTAEVDRLQAELRRLQGQVEVAEKTASDALREAREARKQAVRGAGEGMPPNAAIESEAATDDGSVESESAEVASYRRAYGAWREAEYRECIDRFRDFLQTYPDSSYADDAGFWMADCHFKQGDYKNAVLRFDDVVRNYPNGNKAPDALYRQGESLLKLGPGFHEAARKAFEKVLSEYPDSARAEQAKRQLEVAAAG